jgi:excisionase family DNA binding protein
MRRADGRETHILRSDDRCLFKLSKVIEDNKTCERCLVREVERMKLAKSKRFDVNDIKGMSDIKATSDMKVAKDVKGTGDIKGIKDVKRKRKSKGGGRKKTIENGQTKQMYSTRELSKLLGKAERTLQQWAQEGKIPALRVGIKWRFPKEEIDRWLSERKNGAVESPQLEEKEEPPEFQKPDFLPENQGEPEKDI